jgi:hypothetical protein
MWREAVVANLRYCAVICVQTLRKTRTIIIWDSDCHSWDFKPEYFEYKTGALTTWPQSLMRVFRKTVSLALLIIHIGTEKPCGFVTEIKTLFPVYWILTKYTCWAVCVCARVHVSYFTLNFLLHLAVLLEPWLGSYNSRHCTWHLLIINIYIYMINIALVNLCLVPQYPVRGGIRDLHFLMKMCTDISCRIPWIFSSLIMP